MTILKIIFGILYLLWTIIMFIDLPLGISIVVMSLSFYWLFSSKETDKFQKQLLTKIDTITEILQHINKTKNSSNQTSQSKNKSNLKIKFSWPKSNTGKNKYTKKAQTTNA